MYDICINSRIKYLESDAEVLLYGVIIAVHLVICAIHCVYNRLENMHIRMIGMRYVKLLRHIQSQITLLILIPPKIEALPRVFMTLYGMHQLQKHSTTGESHCRYNESCSWIVMMTLIRKSMARR